MAILSETLLHNGPKRPLRETVIYKLLNDESVDETASTAVDVSQFSQISMLVETAAGTNAGVVDLDAARTADYSGTWDVLGQTAALAASETQIVTIDHGDSPGLPVPFVRVRISTAIGVGTVDVYLICQR